jgi:hypothetical protein
VKGLILTRATRLLVGALAFVVINTTAVAGVAAQAQGSSPVLLCGAGSGWWSCTLSGPEPVANWFVNGKLAAGLYGHHHAQGVCPIGTSVAVKVWYAASPPPFVRYLAVTRSVRCFANAP